MKGIFLNVEKLFESRGQDFNAFIKEMNSQGLNNIVLLKVLTEFEQELTIGKCYADFSEFKKDVFSAGRSEQNNFQELLEKFMPLIFDSFKPTGKTSVWQKLQKFFGGKE